MKTEAKFLFSNGSAFPVKVLCGSLGIVLCMSFNFLHLPIRILGREEKVRDFIRDSFKIFFKKIYFFIKERERVCVYQWVEGGRERIIKQTPQ